MSRAQEIVAEFRAIKQELSEQCVTKCERKAAKNEREEGGRRKLKRDKR